MKNYKVFKHPDGYIEVVKQGWSWPGFILEILGLGFIWALVKKLWVVTILLLVWRIILFLASNNLIPNVDYYGTYYEQQDTLGTALSYSLIFFIVQLAVAIFIGVKGNSLRENNLVSKGYELMGTTFATNSDMAVAEVEKTESNNTTYRM